MERRNFLKILSMLGFGLITNPFSNANFLFAQKPNKNNHNENNNNNENLTIKKFNHIIKKAVTQKWHLLPINDLIINVALEFVGIPYVAGTLDANYNAENNIINENNIISENTIINFAGLDCVTFFENSLCLARCIRKQMYNFDDLINEVTFTRYRNGVISDYSSRLHYTSDWIFDNVKKGVIQDITKNIGGEEYKFEVSYMTKNPQHYKALNQKNSDLLIHKIKEIEANINKQTFYVIPTSKIPQIAKNINNGDIIAIAISTVGLDYGHIGLSFDNKFMHASMKSKKVIIDKSIENYINTVTKNRNIGISVLRPMEPV